MVEEHGRLTSSPAMFRSYNTSPIVVRHLGSKSSTPVFFWQFGRGNGSIQSPARCNAMRPRSGVSVAAMSNAD